VLLLGALSIPKISRTLKNFEIIIINGYFTAVFLLPYLLINRKKTIYCPHTQVKPNWINALLVNFFDAIVFLSGYNRQELIKRNKKLAAKSYVIYNSIGDYKTKKIKKQKENVFQCLFVGRAVEVKRPELFVDGVVEAWKRNKNIKAKMVIASGPLESKIKELIAEKEKFGFLIDLCQNLNKAEVEGIYQDGGVFIFTSTHEEGFGIVLVEAMQHGLPIICTDHPKFREFLGDAALFFTDKESLAERILKLAQDKELYKEYQKRSLQRFSMFSPKETCKKWTELLGKISQN
jgi:glycosyltransferase involved in cell wall biosynthesis